MHRRRFQDYMTQDRDVYGMSKQELKHPSALGQRGEGFNCPNRPQHVIDLHPLELLGIRTQGLTGVRKAPPLLCYFPSLYNIRT